MQAQTPLYQLFIFTLSGRLQFFFTEASFEFYTDEICPLAKWGLEGEEGISEGEVLEDGEDEEGARPPADGDPIDDLMPPVSMTEMSMSIIYVSFCYMDSLY